jgi:hypothetical protein
MRGEEQDSDYAAQNQPVQFKGFLGTFRALDLGHRRLERKDWRVSERYTIDIMSILASASTNYAGESKARTHLVRTKHSFKHGAFLLL